METLLFIAKFLVGLVLIIKGADWLTDGASAIARRYGIPSLVIGLTIVAFGTSAPELVVSVVSAIEGKTEMAIGNVVGSNIFNTLAIMGTTAIIFPVACSKNNIRYDVPFCLLASGLFMVMALHGEVISRLDGIILLCFFLVFMAYTFRMAKAKQKTLPLPPPCEGGEYNDHPEGVTTALSHREGAGGESSVWGSILLFLIGLGCLILGGEWLVDGASGIALLLGVSQSIVALTIVAAGTSFPELVTSVMAARKGDTDMAMGNVLGSNIFNILLILGISSTVAPLSLGNITEFDLSVMTGGVVLLWLFCTFGKKYHYIERYEGICLLLVALAYYTWAVMEATGFTFSY